MNGTVVVKKLSDFASTSSAFLKKIWNPLSDVLTFSPADDIIYPAKNVSVSIDKGSFAFVYGSSFLSRIRIKKFKAYSLEESVYPQPEVVASSLALAMHDFEASRAEVSLSIPKAWAIIRTAELPLTVKENLSSVVSYELDRITPFSPENAFYDYRVLDESSGKITILVAAAKADLIRPYIESLRENGINVNKVTVNLSCIETLCRYIDRGSNSVFIEIKTDGYEGALFLKGSVVETFTGSFITPPIPPLVRGGEGGVEQSKIDSITKEIKPLLDRLQGSGKQAEVMMFLRDKSPSLEDMLKQHLNVPVRVLNKTDMKVKIPGRYEEIPYAAVGGVLESLWPKANGLDLLKKGQHEKSGSPKTLTLLLIVAILALWVVYSVAPLRTEEKRLKEIENQIILRKDEVKRVETIKQEIDSLQNEISTINSFKESRPMSLDILKELTTVLPNSAWLSRVRITDNNVFIEGYASSATGLLPRLEASAYFKKAEFASPTFRDKRMNADRFNIKMEIEGTKKNEGEGMKDEKE
ncbi:MAG: pilus assembly protein PilM [Nitrospirae bacterium]|jgi:Tfp pilus assembly protein PilN|nr:pilus assembly protein PilM [Nitrospirota bacterium]